MIGLVIYLSGVITTAILLYCLLEKGYKVTILDLFLGAVYSMCSWAAFFLIIIIACEDKVVFTKKINKIMTDKEKIRKEVERLRKSYQIMYQELDGESPELMSVCAKRNLCQDILMFIDSMQEEPVSEDLEEVIRKYEQRLEKENPATEAYDFASAIRFGANWQKQQMEAYRIEHCKSLTNEQAELEDNFVSSHVEKNNRIPTFIDAIEYGIEYGKQQMMAKAVDTTVHIDAGGYPYIPQMELYDYGKDIPLAKEGDKYKVILIKEG